FEPLSSLSIEPQAAPRGARGRMIRGLQLELFGASPRQAQAAPRAFVGSLPADLALAQEMAPARPPVAIDKYYRVAEPQGLALGSIASFSLRAFGPAPRAAAAASAPASYDFASPQLARLAGPSVAAAAQLPLIGLDEIPGGGFATPAFDAAGYAPA